MLVARVTFLFLVFKLPAAVEEVVLLGPLGGLEGREVVYLLDQV